MKSSLIEKWRIAPKIDPILIEEMDYKNKDIEQYFDSPISFTDEGLCGIMGVGISRLNEFTVASASLAYAKFLNKNYTKPKIIIGHDNRNNSKLFSEIIYSVLINNGIKAYLFDDNEAQSTALVSYTIRKKKFDGGVAIAAGHKDKRHNGFRLYDVDGSHLSVKKINSIDIEMKSIDPLSVDRSSKGLMFVNSDINSLYFKDIMESRATGYACNNINVSATTLNGTNSQITEKIINELGAKLNVVKKQGLIDSDFKNSKYLNPYDGKTFKKVEKVARKNKSDVMFAIDPEGSNIGMSVKHKKTYKYFDEEQLAAISLNFTLLQLKLKNKIKHDSFIVITQTSSKLLEKIALKYKVRVVKADNGLRNIGEVISNEEGNCLFASDGKGGLLFNVKTSRVSDSSQTLIVLAEMVSYYKSQMTDIYAELRLLYESFGIHRNTSISKKISNSQKSQLIKKVLKSKTLTEKKVDKILDFRKKRGANENDLIKVVYKDGSWISYCFSKKDKTLKVRIENISKPGQDILEIISFEKEVSSFVEDNIEEFEDKKWSWKTFAKYTIFVGIIIGILVFVFKIVYQTTSSTSNNVPIFSVAQAVISSTNRGMWLIVWIWWFFTKILNGWVKKRMFMRLNEKVKIRHVFVSQLMGSVIGFITPFAIGGDAIGYWYLRRKGVKRAPLIATLSAATIWGEMKFALETIFLVAIGWKLYEHIFSTGDVQAHAALIWFFVGLAWSYFAAFMLTLLTMSRRIQEFIVRNTVRILEWLPYISFYDPAGKEAEVQYEFKMIRAGMRRLYNKWWFILELVFYDVVPLLFNPLPLILMSGGLIDPNVAAGPYWAYIVGGDIIGTANSMSLTPGGSGTAEWLNITVRDSLYGGGSLGLQNGGYNGKTIASGIDFMNKIFYSWPDLAISTGTIFTGILLVRKKPFKIFKGKRKYVLIGAEISLVVTAIISLTFLI